MVKKKWVIVTVLLGLEVLVCAGMILAARGIPWHFFYVADTLAEEVFEETFTVSTPAYLEVEGITSNIEISRGTSPVIVVKAIKQAWGRNEREAQAKLKALDIKITHEESKVKVEVIDPETSRFYFFRIGPSSRVDLIILVPHQTVVEANSRSGDISLVGTTGDATLKSRYGAIEIKDVAGKLEVSTSSGDIRAVKVKAGEASLSTSYGEVEVRDARIAYLKADTSSGDVCLDRIYAEGVKLSTNYGKVIAHAVEATSLSAESDGGDIRLKGVVLRDSLEARTKYGDITLDDVAAASYKVDSKSGDLNLSEVTGLLDLHTKSGDIEISKAKSATLKVDTVSGRVVFKGDLLAGSLNRIETRSGSIRLTLPETVALELDARTNSGHIRCDFPVTIEGERERGRLRGVINAPGTTLEIRTVSGDITIEKGG
jgi:lia operon protein LiaG